MAQTAMAISSFPFRCTFFRLIPAVFFLNLLQIKAQVTTDSLVPRLPTVIKTYHEQQETDAIPPDTTLDHSNRNFITPEHPVQDLGATGSPCKPLLFNGAYIPFATNGFNQFNPFVLRNDSVRYWRTNKRFTELNYRHGFFREQGIEVLHSQNILNNWNSGVYFRRVNVQDFTPRGDTYFNNVLIFSDYNSRNNRYHLYLNAIWNAIRIQTNGGISNDSVFNDQTSNLDMKGLPVRMLGAGIRYKERSFHAGHYYDLIHTADSSSWSLRLGTTQQLTSGQFAYYDIESDSSFYTNFYRGFEVTDSTHFSDFRNRVQLTVVRKVNSPAIRKYSLTAYSEQQYFSYWQQELASRNNTGIGLEGSLDAKRIGIRFNLLSLVSGADRNNHTATASIEQHIGKFSLLLELKDVLSSAPMIFRTMDANHFRWSNDLEPVHSTDASLLLKYDPFSISIKAVHQQLDRFIYFRQDATPAVAAAAFSVNSFNLKKEFRRGRWGSGHSVTFQAVDVNAPVHVPDWLTLHSVWWEQHYRRNQIGIRAGLEARFISAFRGDRFMPATGSYYLQDSITTGNIWIGSVFFNVQLKSAVFFLKLDNLGDGLFTKNYFLTPDYPYPGRVFRYGIRWRFFDQ